MTKFLIDVNLPYKFKLWNNAKFEQVRDINDEWTDSQIWNYAKKRNLIIVSKDSDFSNRIISSSPPPKVVHLKIGNMKINELYYFLNSHWEKIEKQTHDHKLVNVYFDKITAI